MTWESWDFAFGVTLPNLLMLLLGVFLRYSRLIDEPFCDKATRLVFTVALPCLLFFSITTNHSDITPHITLAMYAAVSTIVSFLVLELISPFLVPEPRERGIFVQGGFRSNTAILGLAYCAAAYGEEGVVLGSIYMVSTVILFNILSIITLTRSLSPHGNNQMNVGPIVRSIAKNPLIIAIISALIFSLTGIALPETLITTGKFISNLALPLALLCAGASLDWRMMFRSSNTAMYSSVARLLFVPGLITFGGWLVGFHGVALGVIFLLTASPTAAVSYIMTRAMGGNATLAANIIAMTTVGSFFTTAIGLYLLRSNGLI